MWARVFGYGEAGLRSLSALAGVATVPVAYGAARKLISTRAGLIAAALTACNPLLIWYSQEARSYSLLVLLTAVALLAFAHARANPTPRALIAWTITSGAGARHPLLRGAGDRPAGGLAAGRPPAQRGRSRSRSGPSPPAGWR